MAHVIVTLGEHASEHQIWEQEDVVVLSSVVLRRMIFLERAEQMQGRRLDDTLGSPVSTVEPMR